MTKKEDITRFWIGTKCGVALLYALQVLVTLILPIHIEHKVITRATIKDGRHTQSFYGDLGV